MFVPIRRIYWIGYGSYQNSISYFYYYISLFTKRCLFRSYKLHTYVYQQLLQIFYRPCHMCLLGYQYSGSCQLFYHFFFHVTRLPNFSIFHNLILHQIYDWLFKLKKSFLVYVHIYQSPNSFYFQKSDVIFVFCF